MDSMIVNWNEMTRSGVNREEAYRLFAEEEMTLRQIAEKLGCSTKTIGRIFKEEGWKATRELNRDEICRLYFEENLSLVDIAENFGFKSGYPIKKILLEMGWALRESDGLSVEEIREQLFGSECKMCGDKREVIHKKDGTPHGRYTLWTKESLTSLKPEEWVALCRPCHRAVHALMTKAGFEWEEVRDVLMRIIKQAEADG